MNKEYIVSYSFEGNLKEKICSTLEDAHQEAERLSKEYTEAIILEKSDYKDKNSTMNESFEIRYKDGKEISAEKQFSFKKVKFWKS